MSRTAVFFYGSLRDEILLSCVLGRDPEDVSLRPARLLDHEIRAVQGEGFPCAIPAPGAAAPGGLLEDATPDELARIAFFEDDEEFELRPERVETEHGPADALVCRPIGATAPGAPWSYEAWPEAERARLRESAREVMQLHAQGADWSEPALWPGIECRAAARVQAARAPARGGLLPTLPTAPAEVVARDLPYAGFHAAERLSVRVPRLAGGLSAPAERSVWVTGDAAIVLPYDPRRDAVLLLTQWRPGPFVRGDAQCWPIEAPAGRVDAGEDPAEAARRELLEETGVAAGRVEPAGGWYPSPGSTSQFFHTFVAEADLARADGQGGLETESEEIAFRVLPLDDALARADAGGIDCGPALTLLLWLARHRARLRAAWT